MKNTAATDPRVLLLAQEDNVCVACATLQAGTDIVVDGEAMPVRELIPLGHKLARRPIAAGQDVLKYGAPIGTASRDIGRGEHVHTQNLRSNYLPTYTLDGRNPYVRAVR